MKTAISIPDSIFEAAEEVAAKNGYSRSELYTRAIADWLERHRDDRVREQLDAVYGSEDGGDPISVSLEPELTELQFRSVRPRRAK